MSLTVNRPASGFNKTRQKYINLKFVKLCFQTSSVWVTGRLVTGDWQTGSPRASSPAIQRKILPNSFAKNWAAGSSETSVTAYRNTRRHNPNGHSLNIYICKTMKALSSVWALSTEHFPLCYNNRQNTSRSVTTTDRTLPALL
jgi:hypothetical protein